MTERMLEKARLGLPWELADCAPDTPILLGFSGGADSVALLHVLAELQTRYGFSLTLAHVNHGIRGAEALRDRAFCEERARAYGLELCILDADVPSYAKERGMGIEEAARQVRYDYFAHLMKERGIPLLATAHHATDHLETLLFRLSRGTTLAGLGGIAPARPFEGGMLVRPLLRFSKEDLLAYCNAVGLPYVSDSTNADTAYARNRLRAEAVPTLEALFSGAAERTVEMSERLREDEACLDAMAAEYLDGAAENALSVNSLTKQPTAILRRVLKKWAEAACGSLENVHVEALLHLVKENGVSECVALPRRQYAHVREGRLCLCGEQPTAPTPYRLPFSEGDVAVADTGIVIRVRRKGEGRAHKQTSLAHTILKVSFDSIGGDAYWRSRAAGDVLLMGGMHRKLRKLYAACGVPVHLRERIPLLCDGEGVLWAPLVGARDGVKPDAEGFEIEILLTYGSGNTAETP